MLKYTFKLKEADSSLTIPKKALMESEGNKYVYVMTGGEQFEKRDVSTGRDDGEHIVIHKGLKTGEVMVSQGHTTSSSPPCREPALP
ncbi:MAG: hypothetical protein U5L09_16400 [Bacteroidales bacterium]|nr:hypothetical protein [Bacteroidales bacterium]